MDFKSHNFVHWVDGMKLSSNHFVEEYKATQFAIMKLAGAFLNDHNYGLLPQTASSKGSLVFDLRIESPATIHVSLQQLIGVTRSGVVIRQVIGESKVLEKTFSVKLTADDSEKQLLIVASVDPFDFEPYGTPNPEELPLRYPNIKPKIELSLVQRDQVAKEVIAEGIPIARVIHKSGELLYDEAYIAPAVSIDSHPDLIGFFQNFLRFLQDLDTNVLKMLFRMNSKSNLSTLAENVQTIGKAVVSFMERELDNMQYFGTKSSPVYIIACAARLARTLRLNLEMLKGAGKEEMLQYFSEWSSLKPGEYDGALDELINLRYNHTDIDAILRKVLQFCKVNGKLFKDLSELDYIGKRKDSNVFVAEKTEFKSTPEPKTTRKWEF